MTGSQGGLTGGRQLLASLSSSVPADTRRKCGVVLAGERAPRRLLGPITQQPSSPQRAGGYVFVSPGLGVMGPYLQMRKD